MVLGLEEKGLVQCRNTSLLHWPVREVIDMLAVAVGSVDPHGDSQVYRRPGGTRGSSGRTLPGISQGGLEESPGGTRSDV